MSVILGVLAVAAAAPTVFLAIELVLANHASRPRVEVGKQNSEGLFVLVPAHNEAAVIESTLDSLISEVSDRSQILVVADNCTDDTAAIATRRGVDVVERKDEAKKGKGYALEFGVNQLLLRPNRPSCVVFVDADCIVEPNTVHTLAEKCVATGGPTQALYLIKNRDATDVRQKLAEFALVVKNQVRPLGLLRLGLPCQLSGTGMAFPVEVLKKVKLGSAHIVEDMKLGIDCARLGFSPMFCPDAVAVSYFPDEPESIRTQRTRWEHGHLGVMFYGIYELLKAAIVKRDKNCLGMALDLTVPPLAFLVLLLTLLTVVAALSSWLFQSGLFALWVSAAAILLLVVAVLTAWYRFGRGVVSAGELLWIPAYIVAKIPIYVRYWLKRQVEWVRTNRS